ncbi:MAG: S8 family serine peptidase, partial [Verrucomicrobiae bacterium]|nr:S8 family serine peptidase [Verrucomicrobiae bacterium]
MHPGDALPGQFIIQTRSGVPPTRVSQRNGLTPDHVYDAALQGFSGFVPPGLLPKLASDPDVLRITPNRMVSIIGKPDKTGGGKGGKPGGGDPPPPPPEGQIVPEGVARVGAPLAHAVGITGGGVGVAIVDTGIDFNHVDLAANLRPEWHSSFPGLTAQDDHAHGTHVAGIVAAVDNSEDVLGVAPDAGLYAVKVLDYWGDGSDAEVIAGLDWIVANAALVDPPIKVANLSLGRPASADDSLLQAAIQRVVSAGV